jgi:hypothetical protein
MDTFPSDSSARLTVPDVVRRNAFLFIVIGALIALGGAYEYGRYTVYQAYPQLSEIERMQALLAKVGKLIQLPTGETPTMATIADAASAKETQPFLSAAENGDILIVYANAQQAFVYRPSTNKLVAVGPVNTAAQKALPKAIKDTTDDSTNATTTKK